MKCQRMHVNMFHTVDKLSDSRQQANACDMMGAYFRGDGINL